VLSFLIEIVYGTNAGKLASASITVSANDYTEAYTLARDHIAKTRRPPRVYGGRNIGRPFFVDASVPGIVAAKAEA
jgi:hypothetical protein